MVVTSGIERAIQYFHAVRAYLQERKSPYQAIVAFSGEHEYGGAKVTEAILNGFPSERYRRSDPGRSLSLSDLRRQVPDRLRRAAAAHDVRRQGAVRHQGGSDAVPAQPRAPAEARRVRARLHERHRDDHAGVFADYYRTTILSDETDPNKLHDLKAALDGYQVYQPEQVEQLVRLYLGGADRDRLDPILDACVAVYKASSTRTAKWTSKARRRRSPAPTTFSLRSCPTPTPMGEALDFPELPDARSCPRPARRTCRRASSKPSTWTATGSRSRPRIGSQLPDAGRRNRSGADRWRRS